MLYIWLGVVILLVIVELLTINLTTIWFVASGVVAMFSTFIIDEFSKQFAIFAILGIILLVTTRPLLIKLLLKSNIEKTNIDRIIGMNGKVIDDILPNQYGEVKVDGKIWFAYSEENNKIESNSLVEVLEINGTKLKVKEVI